MYWRQMSTCWGGRLSKCIPLQVNNLLEFDIEYWAYYCQGFQPHILVSKISDVTDQCHSVPQCGQAVTSRSANTSTFN